MCGICGFVGSYPMTKDAAAILHRMNAALVHRGPDDAGEWLGPGVALGTRRLSIIDLTAAGHQPMHSADGALTVTFNGEIYNFQSIRAALEARGRQFRSHSDTECLLHLYAEYGEAMLPHLRGMFAFALWDQARRRLFVVRDRLGKKPLYYAATGGVFAFASEIKSLLTLPVVSRELDWEAVDHYFSQRFVLGPRTIFRDVKKLLPGHFLVAEEGKPLRVQLYWQPPHADATATAPDLDELDELLQTSVRLRLVSDVPVGAFLSGGLDSSMMVALIAKLHPRPLKTFSIGFDVPGAYDEAPFARRVSERFGTQHHARMFTAKDMSNALPDAVYHLDEPLADAAAIPTLLLSRAAAKEVKVVLTGDGADEVFAGYRRHSLERLISKAQRLFPPIRHGAAVVGRFAAGSRARKALRLLQENPQARITEYHAVFRPEERAALFAPPDQMQPDHRAYEDPAGFPSTVDWLLWEELRSWLPDDFLMKVDKMSMAASLEARTPFLDHLLVERLAKLPARFKLNWRQNKIPLRQLARRYLPTEIVDRPKHGFEIPLDTWMRTELKAFAADLLLANQPAPAPAPPLVRRYWDEHQQGTANHGLKLWTILCWNLWRDTYLKHG
jgi:asparagine synthase (glutamine-hydrolysing)